MKKIYPSSAYIHSPYFDQEEFDNRIEEQVRRHDRIMLWGILVFGIAVVLFAELS